MQFIGKEFWFPDVEEADEEGLLAVGGDLHPDRLLMAYQKGIFPWFIESGLVFWYCPPERFVLYPHEVKISHSMKQLIKKGSFTVTENQCFTQVVQLCAATHKFTSGSTWITNNFVRSYTELHGLGKARSVEVWDGDKLVGGLYGVEVGNIFCGESMFSLVPNTSKLALIHVCQTQRYSLIDCQIYSDHLATMGGKLIDRRLFLEFLPV